MRNLLIITCIMFVSCKTSVTKSDTSINDKEKEAWIFAFKAYAFAACMKHTGVKIDKDASASLNFEVLGDLEILSKTDSLGKSFSKVIDERLVWLQDGESKGYKAITNGCLAFYNSKELDSIANAEYDKIK